MNTTKKSLKVLWIVFGLILLTKVLISLFRNGPFIFPDEGCIIQRAIHFAATFQLESCEKILGAPFGDAYPLYSIIIAPIYRFFHGLLAYKLVLILNSILVSVLIFPLYKIFNTFIRNNRYCLFASAITVFLPQFTVFEKTLMTETLYSVLLIWSLFFYIRSLEPNKRAFINKIIAVLLAVLTALTRPFGFILLIGIMVNELIISKRKKIVVLLYLPISIALASLAIFFFSRGVLGSVLANLGMLNQFANWKYLIKSVSDQINSFTVATFFLPLFIFLSCLFKKDFKKFNKIKYLILVYIILNFAISMHHIFSYLITLDYSPVLITRYINSSVILIFISSLIFIQKYRGFKFTFGSTLLTLSLIVSMLFHDSSKFGFSLNLDLMSLLDLNAHRLAKDLIPTWDSYKNFLLPVIFLLFLVLLMRNKKLLVSVISSAVILFSIASYVTVQNYSNSSVLESSLDEIKKSNIAFIIGVGDNHALGEFWILSSISKHIIRPILIYNNNDFVIDDVSFKDSQTFKDADYVISSHRADLPLDGYTNDGLFVYKKE